MTLYEKYGHCLIPAGTKLYKGGDSADIDTCLFFGLQMYVGKAFQNGSNIVQIWEVKRDFKVLFMVLELNRRSWAKSAIVDIYNKYYPSEFGLNDLDIKHFDHQKRDKFINKLKEEKIIGWLTSLENKVELELCLFPDQQEFEAVIKLGKVTKKNISDYNSANALDKIEINPSERFLKRTQEKLQDSPFENYKSKIDAWIQDDIKQGLPEVQAKQDYPNLRIKLKI